MNVDEMQLKMAGTFIESFDPVRFAPENSYERPRQDDPNKWTRGAHPRIELMLSLLFGQFMAVPEPVSFDSRGFMQTASIISDIWLSRDQITSEPPFRLALRPGKASYSSMVADLLSQTTAEKTFILSGQPKEISDDFPLRRELAARVRKEEFDRAERLAINKEMRTWIRQMKQLNGYFSRVASLSALPSRVPLPTRVMSLINTPLAEVPGELNVLRAALDMARRIPGMEYTNRSHIRLNEERIKESLAEAKIDVEAYNGLLEHIDEAYNRTVADSIGVWTSLFSTRNNITSPFVRAAENYSQHANGAGDLSLFFRFTQDDASMGALAESLWGRDEEAEERKFWEQIIDILEDDDWRDSVSHLSPVSLTSISMLDRPEIDKYERAFDDHVDFLAKALSEKFILRAPEGWSEVRKEMVARTTEQTIIQTLQGLTLLQTLTGGGSTEIALPLCLAMVARVVVVPVVKKLLKDRSDENHLRHLKITDALQGSVQVHRQLLGNIEEKPDGK